ncbi:Flp family type IVb pilin [Sphingomonas sp. LaA6.9]|uniref:Flp family type IVb pilin n=1 Tax=Sphingomonas sp. LaA6.9 TaxID=2919914 RepID=UPI001F503FD2|nr:Flp family type IVb pilin [Sphingomonas sp. LaA6.9]MCJ8157619.1 Flp family type IVb pilin [Sphingomonas sp. LaA6.9]
MKFFKKMLRDSKAATAIEYGLIAALIAVAGVSAFQVLGTQISTTMNNAADKMKTS